MSNLDRLQAWYLAQCDERWELAHGVSVESVDNPGWQVRVDLTGTRWAGREFVPETLDRSEHDWYRCWVEANTFRAACGPCNLDEVLGRFLDWTGTPDAAPPAGQAVDDLLRARIEEREMLGRADS